MDFNGKCIDDVFSDLEEFKELDMDYSSGRILGSMCTEPDSVGMRAYRMFSESNLGDPGLFKGTTLLEGEVINMIGNLLHLNDACGHIVTGGTEANITAMCAAKYIFEEKHPGVKPEIILPKSAHFSFKKIISMLSLKPVYVPLNEDYKIDTSKLEELITENTMAIVAIAGTTELGYVDDIEEISEIAYRNNVYLHVDAAFGGFVIPFLNYDRDDEILFDFKCRGVSSITIDPHEMGLAPIPSGGIIFRNKEHLKKLAVKTPYLTKDEQTTIVGTRSGASTAAIWSLLKYYGFSGYKEIVDNAMELTKYTYEKLDSIEGVIVRKPELNLISFYVEHLDVDILQKQLEDMGWNISVSEYPHALRIVLMPHVKEEHINDFISDLKKLI